MTTPRNTLWKYLRLQLCCVCAQNVRREDGLPLDIVRRQLRGVPVMIHAGGCQAIYESHHGTAEAPREYVPLKKRRRSGEFNV